MPDTVKGLLVDPFPLSMQAKLQALPYFDSKYAPNWTRADILANLSDIQVLVMNSKTKVDRELLDAAPNLKLLCRAGVGMDHFDLPLLEERGVKVVNASGANARPVGEQAVGMLLSLLHNIHTAHDEVRQFQWKREANRGLELANRTVGIIGFGHTGSAFAKNLSGFGCRILAYDKYKSGYAPDYVEESELEALYLNCDVLSLHIPLTSETKGWINANFLSRFTSPLYLLNLARGPIVPLSGLIQAIEKEDVVAAALDVLENEKFDHLSGGEQRDLQGLFDSKKVVFTPHIGGWSHESLQRINDAMLQAVTLYMAEHNQ